MTAQREPFVKVYYSIIDDPKFASIYDNDAALATWLRLLLVADGSHPAPAPIPYGTRKRPLDALVDAGLIDLQPGHRYRVHGLAKERAKRSAAGKAGADARWGANAEPTQSERNAIALVPHSDSDASPTRAEQSRREQSPQGTPDAFDTYQRLTTRIAKGGAAQWIGRLIDKYDEALVERAIVHAHGQDSDPSTLLGRVEGLLDQRAFREEKRAEQARRERPIREMEEQRKRIEEATPEQLAAIEANKQRVADMLANAGKEMP